MKVHFCQKSSFLDKESWLDDIIEYHFPQNNCFLLGLTGIILSLIREMDWSKIKVRILYIIARHWYNKDIFYENVIYDQILIHRKFYLWICLSLQGAYGMCIEDDSYLNLPSSFQLTWLFLVYCEENELFLVRPNYGNFSDRDTLFEVLPKEKQ